MISQVQEWESEALKIAAPVVIAVVVALFSPTFLTSRQLRRDLAIDVEILAKLPDGEQSELLEEVRRRTRRLVALSRYPSVARGEVFALVVLFAGIATGIWAFASGHRDELASTGVVAPALFLLWAWFTTSWSPRAAKRLTYLSRHLNADETASLNNLMRNTNAGLQLLGLYTGLFSGLALVAGCVEQGWMPWSRGWILLVVWWVVAGTILTLTIRHSTLHAILEPGSIFQKGMGSRLDIEA